MANDRKTFKITASQGHFLLQHSAVAQIPDKLGDHTYSPVDRAIIQGLITALFSELKAYSPFAQEFEVGKSTKLLFGEKRNWRRETPDSTRWLLEDPELIHTVSLTADAVYGAAWICYAALIPREDPRTPGAGGTMVSPLEAADTVWPLLKVLRKSESVMEQLGIKKFSKKEHGWADDTVEEVPAKVIEFPQKAEPQP